MANNTDNPDCREAISALRERVKAIEVQIRLMKPAEILQFKGKVLEALKIIDQDIEGLGDTIEKAETIQLAFNIDTTTKISDLKVALASVTTKVAVYSLFIAAGASTIFTIILRNFLNN